MHSALQQYRSGVLTPWRLTSPIQLAVTVMTPEMADRAMRCPGARRIDGRTVGFEQPDMQEAFRAFYTVTTMTNRPLY